MTIEIVSDVDFYDPDNLIPYLELDAAILRGITTAMLDFSNPDCYAGSGSIPNGTTFKSLTHDVALATASSTFSAGVNGGMLKFGGSVPKVTLPDTFKLPSNTKKFLAILWAKLPPNGYQTAQSGVQNALMGYAANTSTLCQWAMIIQTVQATGLPNQFQVLGPASGGVAGAAALSNADTLALCDGNLHQIAFLWDGESSPGQRSMSIYIDKVLKLAGSPSAWDGNFNVPVSGVALGTLSAFQAAYPTDGLYLGRPSLWNLTGSGKSVEDIIAADWDAAQGYLA